MVLEANVILSVANNIMNEFLKSKKNIISALTLLILILAVPLGMQLIRQQQVIKSRAATGATGVTFSGPNVKVVNNKTVVKLDADGNAIVDLIITAPNAPGTQPSPTPSPAATTSPTPTPSPSPRASP